MGKSAPKGAARGKRPTKADAWAAYEKSMLDARAAAFALADAIERYVLLAEEKQPFRLYDLLFLAGCKYREALRKAAPYHFACIPFVGCSLGVNESNEELVALMRELRGTAVPVVRRDGPRVLITFRYADDGIAGFFDVELRSMRPFGSPRRTPEEAAAEQRVVDAWREERMVL